jgi:hypothetical protein
LICAVARSTEGVWKSDPPEGCPFPRSKHITGVAFTGRHAEYTKADTWYPSWASDANLYTPFTDGTVGSLKALSHGDHATTGNAKIVGDNPLSLTVIPLSLETASSLPYGGNYPSANLIHNNVWYYGTYTLDDRVDEPHNCNWCIMGPFVGFRISTDYGLSWKPAPLTPRQNLFNESGKDGGKVRMGAPHFVDFGQNMRYSPDGKAYLVAHGSIRPGMTHSWIAGDQVYMARVLPSPENVNDPTKWEFFAGHDTRGKAKWTRKFSEIQPLLEWTDHMGVVTATYHPGLKRYFMWITDPEGLGGVIDHVIKLKKGVPYRTYVLESASLTGPWKLVTYMRNFGEQACFVNMPSKFISSDGRSAWLVYSNNWSQDQKINPPGGRYAMCLHLHHSKLSVNARFSLSVTAHYAVVSFASITDTIVAETDSCRSASMQWGLPNAGPPSHRLQNPANVQR